MVQAYNLSLYAGADEELELAMEFLTPAFGEVSMNTQLNPGDTPRLSL